MLGSDWLANYHVLWDFAKGEVTIDGTAHRLVSKKGPHRWCRRVVVADDVLVPANSQLDIAAQVQYGRIGQNNSNDLLSTWSTEPLELKKGLLVARTLLPDRATNLPVRVLNVTEHPIKLARGITVSELQPVSVLPPRVQHPAVTEHNGSDDTIIEQLVAKVDASVPQHAKEQLRGVLKKHINVFSRSERDLSFTDAVIHDIDT